MKKFLLLWLAICLVVVFLPKLLNRFTPKTIIKEVPIYRIKEVIKEIEKEKEKLIYTDKRFDLFIIHQIDEDTFVMNMTDNFDDTIWEVSNTKANQGLLLHRKRKLPSSTVSMSSIGWNKKE